MKKIGCISVVCGIALLLLSGFAVLMLSFFFLLTADKEEVSVVRGKNESELEPFYTVVTRWDTCRLPLIKPYELFSTFRGLKEPCLMDTSDKSDYQFGKQICNVIKFNVFKKYLVAAVKPLGNSRTGLIQEIPFNNLMTVYLIFDLNSIKWPRLELERNYALGKVDKFGEKIKRNTKPPYFIYIDYGYGKAITTEKFTDYKAFLKRAEHYGFNRKGMLNNYNKIELSIPEKYRDCIFFDKQELIQGLKKRGIPENIKLFKPEYFFSKFVNEGRCPWFPRPNKKVKDSGQKK